MSAPWTRLPVLVRSGHHLDATAPGVKHQLKLAPIQAAGASAAGYSPPDAGFSLVADRAVMARLLLGGLVGPEQNSPARSSRPATQLSLS